MGWIQILDGLTTLISQENSERQVSEQHSLMQYLANSLAPD